MTLTPRVVLVHRQTEYDGLLARHGTRGQAEFFLRTRGRRIDEVDAAHDATVRALAAATAAIPLDWRRGTVEREDLARFVFAPEDVVVVVGQDGLVANVAKYLDGQPVIGIDPLPGSNAGVLVRHGVDELAELLRVTVGPQVDEVAERRTMVEAVTDDGQTLVALNEVFVGHPTHQTARWTLHPPGGAAERQACSGLLVGTGTGATGWCASVSRERGGPVRLPAAGERRLAWFVREAWPSPTTGTTMTAGELHDVPLVVTVETDGLVAFGDGIEADRLTLAWGQQVAIGVSDRVLRLL